MSRLFLGLFRGFYTRATAQKPPRHPIPNRRCIVQQILTSVNTFFPHAHTLWEGFPTVGGVSQPRFLATVEGLPSPDSPTVLNAGYSPHPTKPMSRS